MKKTKQLFLIVLFLAFMGPSLAHGYVLYEKSGVNQEINVSNGGYTFYAPAGTGGAFSYSQPSFMTTDQQIDTLRLKMLSGFDCTTANGNTTLLYAINGTTTYDRTGPGVIKDTNYCDIPINVPAGVNLGMVYAYGVPGILIGSSTNGGYSYANYASPTPGGFAFALCSYGDCRSALGADTYMQPKADTYTTLKYETPYNQYNYLQYNYNGAPASGFWKLSLLLESAGTSTVTVSGGCNYSGMQQIASLQVSSYGVYDFMFSNSAKPCYFGYFGVSMTTPGDPAVKVYGTKDDLAPGYVYSNSGGITENELVDFAFGINITLTPQIPVAPSCFDGIQNQNEIGIDTGGVCTPAVVIAVVCADGIMNGDESDIDDGGRCNTHIVGFTPENGAVITGPTVNFTLDVWVNPKDIGTFIGVNLNFHNIDQNVLLLNELSPSSFYLLDAFRVENPGLFHFEESRTVGNGNYTVEAVLERAYLGGWIINPFSNINQTIYKHFIVGEGTFIGTVSQSGYDALNGTASGAVVPGTTIATVASNCNPFAGIFDIQKCGIYLFVPGGEYLAKTMQDMKSGLLTRAPWGYFYRVYDIWNNPSKTSLPAMVFKVQMGAGNDNTPGYETITIDPGDMIAGAGNLLNDIRDPHTNKNAKDVFGPMVQLAFALAVVFTIVADLTGSHKHVGGDTGENKKKLS